MSPGGRARAGGLDAAFALARGAGRPAFIPYFTAGDPDLATSRRIATALQRGGADVLEIGVPFSDPIADGPVNQRAADRALRAGTSLGDVVDLAAALRADGSPPIVLFTYYNPIHRMGLDTFAGRAAAAGVSAVLVTDLPADEAGDLLSALGPRGIEMIHFVAPTTAPPRLARIAAAARGFLYCISRTGVTGTRDALPPDLLPWLRKVRAVCRAPIAVGFGISRPDQLRAVAAHADGVVVGSAIVRLIEECGRDAGLERRLESFCRQLTGG